MSDARVKCARRPQWRVAALAAFVAVASAFPGTADARESPPPAPGIYTEPGPGPASRTRAADFVDELLEREAASTPQRVEPADLDRGIVFDAEGGLRVLTADPDAGAASSRAGLERSDRPARRAGLGSGSDADPSWDAAALPVAALIVALAAGAEARRRRRG